LGDSSIRRRHSSEETESCSSGVETPEERVYTSKLKLRPPEVRWLYVKNVKRADGTPALPFAKRLWVNSFGIHERRGDDVG